ncbi:MAG: DUF4167 domain-containing protein [Novosphingobium sp.]
MSGHHACRKDSWCETDDSRSGLEKRVQEPVKEHSPLNNNRGNNRRRGRGNRQSNGGGGGQQLNRIDSRARGNAPQMLEKYRKLAHDAHLNGDRVQAEYYLQFADHYFRVIADQRLRQEEQRATRQDRFPEGGDEGGDDGEFTNGNDFPAFDQPVYNRREDRAPREERGNREDRGNREERSPREERGNREDRGNREERTPREDRDQRVDEDANEAAEMAGDDGAAEGNVFEPAENPFVRENREPRGNRGLRPRRDDRRPRRSRDDDEAPAGLDASILPPAIGAGREEPAPVAEVAEEAPAPRKRTRKPKAEAAEEAAE